MASDPRPNTLSLEGFFPLLDLPTAPLPHRGSVSPCRAEIPTLSGPKVFDPVGVSAHHCLKSFSCNTYGSTRKCSKQRTYMNAKPFRYNTYKKHEGGGPSISTRKPPSLRFELYSPLRRSSLAGSRQKYPADPQRPVSYRESLRRQSCFSRFDPGVPRLRAQNPRAPRSHEQLHPPDCFLCDRFAHLGFLWNLPSRRASRRRPYSHFQWLGNAEEQRGSGSRPGRSEKREHDGHFSQRFLSAYPAAYRRPRLDFHGHHARSQRTAPPRPKSSCSSRRGDCLGARSRNHLSLLRLRRSPRRDHRRNRDEHRAAALLFSPRLHRRPNSLEWRESLASFSAPSRGLRLLCRAWCIMDFHHRDETRSSEFHRVPQLRGRIVSEQRRVARPRGRSHHDRRPRLPWLRFTIRNSQRRADSLPRKTRHRQTRDGFTICGGMDALERSSRLLRAGVFRLGGPADSRGFRGPDCIRGGLRQGAPHRNRGFARCQSDCCAGFGRERIRCLRAHPSIPKRPRRYRRLAEPACPRRF